MHKVSIVFASFTNGTLEGRIVYEFRRSYRSWDEMTVDTTPSHELFKHNFISYKGFYGVSLRLTINLTPILIIVLDIHT